MPIFSMTHTDGRISELMARLTALERERAEIVAEINALRSVQNERAAAVKVVPSGRADDSANRNSPIEKKIALFRRLFRGRSDVFPIRWENRTTGRSGYAPACANEWQRGICEKPRVKCSACPNQAFLVVDDASIERHLRGTDANGAPFVMGVYPMLADNTCSFLAADFDEGGWRRDAFAFRDSCERHGILVAIERSRSGNGAHAWIFFDEPIPAVLARRLGAVLITDTMERVPDIGFGSYDRFFPSQDLLPAGGFGNLIALPLQGLARSCGNSEFIDEFCSQWAFLSAIAPMPRAKVEHLVEEASASGKIIGVRIPLVDEDEEPWLAPPSRRQTPPAIREPLPSVIAVVQADQIYLPRHALPPSLIARLIRLAAFQNPDFCAAQAMRRSTHDKPRIISCAELTSHHVALPRGCFDAVQDLLASFGVTVTIEDCRFSGAAIPFAFTGALRSDQETAITALLPHDTGVLAATTAFGKTILAIRMMAERGRNTLVLVHRRQLMDQWIERLTAFSNMPRDAIGMIGGGRRKPKGQVDVALIQSLVRKGEVDDIVRDYGHLVVDECHHLSAVSFELVARRSKARYVLGLSATVTRKDGHHPIIVMQCGPIRHRVDARSEAGKRPFDHVVRIRDTSFQLQATLDTSAPSIQDVFEEMVADEARNDLIFDEVLRALEAGRSPLVITERTAHLEIIAKRLERFAKHVVVLRGGQSEKQRRDIATRLAAIPQAEERVIVATGRYLGEGFDDSRLDTLFLTMPIAWKGTLAQYAGRLHRLNDVNREVIIYDYADMRVPVLARMAAKRRVGYQAIGYKVLGTRDLFSDRAVMPNEPT
jgi:superfamily II DNA or RNA helicase